MFKRLKKFIDRWLGSTAGAICGALLGCALIFAYGEIFESNIIVDTGIFEISHGALNPTHRMFLTYFIGFIGGAFLLGNVCGAFTDIRNIKKRPITGICAICGALLGCALGVACEIYFGPDITVPLVLFKIAIGSLDAVSRKLLMSVIFGITGASYLGKIGSNFESEEELHGTREELCKMIIDNAVRQVGKVKPTCHWRVEILGIFDWNSVYTINSEIVDIRKEMIRSLGSKAFGKNITKSEMDRFHVGGEFWGRTRSQVEASASADTEDIGRKACEYFSANRTRDVKASKYFSANR